MVFYQDVYKRQEVRQALEQSNKQMREEQLSKNTAELNLRQSINKKKEIIASYIDASEEAAKLEKEILEIDESLSHVSGSLATVSYTHLRLKTARIPFLRF